MLPISKVDGGDNPVDLMTQTVGIELAKKHVQALGITFGYGRAGAVAELHYIDEKDEWKVEHEVHLLKRDNDPWRAPNRTLVPRRRGRVPCS